MTHASYDVLLFAGLRQALGRPMIRVDVPAPATVSGLVAAVVAAAPELAQSAPYCRVAVDHEFVDGDFVLTEGQEIALIPPVSGGHDLEPPTVAADGPPQVRLSDRPLEIDAATAAVSHVGAGGITLFVGNVRGRSRGQSIDHLEYEAYAPMAVEVMATIVREVQEEVSGARVAIHHRIGRLEIGETAVVVAASAPHRGQAFMACRLAIEALKRDVPIWKREFAESGDMWLGRGA